MVHKNNESQRGAEANVDSSFHFLAFHCKSRIGQFQLSQQRTERLTHANMCFCGLS